MADWKRIATRLVAEVERGVDAVKYAAARARGPRRPVVVTYRSYGTRRRLVVRGRVLEAKRIPEATPDDPWWRNLRSALLRLESDELPGARVRARAGGALMEAETDEEGHFRAVLEPPDPLPDRVWQEAFVELVEPAGLDADARALVLTPRSDAALGVISDLDDTVIRTGAHDLLTAARNTLLANAHTRLPFPGIAPFYRGLTGDPGDGELRNPIFYVSSSPWNLYDVIADLLRIRGIPMGAILLRDWGVSAQELLPTTHGRHKRSVIERILDTYPGLPFLLVGDSGQQDPEIYRGVVRTHPGRIRAVYIRDVTRGPRTAAVQRIGEEIGDAGAPFVLAADTLDAARHAADRDWITGPSLAAVEDDVRTR